MNKPLVCLSLITVVLLLGGCGDGATNESNGAIPGMAAASPGIIHTSNPLTQQLTDDEFNTLDDIDQYRVANN